MNVRRRHARIVGDWLVFELAVSKAKGRQKSSESRLPLSSRGGKVLTSYLGWFDNQFHDESASLFGLEPGNRPSASIVALSLRKAFGMSRSAGYGEGLVDQSHALRRGAAVCMYSLEIQTNRMCQWGRWASADSMDTYIKDRASRTAGPADRICYGWMIPTE